MTGNKQKPTITCITNRIVIFNNFFFSNLKGCLKKVFSVYPFSELFVKASEKVLFLSSGPAFTPPLFISGFKLSILSYLWPVKSTQYSPNKGNILPGKKFIWRYSNSFPEVGCRTQSGSKLEIPSDWAYLSYFVFSNTFFFNDSVKDFKSCLCILLYFHPDTYHN